MYSLLPQPFHAEFCPHWSRRVRPVHTAPGRMKRQRQESEHG